MVQYHELYINLEENNIALRDAIICRALFVNTLIKFVILARDIQFIILGRDLDIQLLL